MKPVLTVSIQCFFLYHRTCLSAAAGFMRGMWASRICFKVKPFCYEFVTRLKFAYCKALMNTYLMLLFSLKECMELLQWTKGYLEIPVGATT